MNQTDAEYLSRLRQLENASALPPFRTRRSPYWQEVPFVAKAQSYAWKCNVSGALQCTLTEGDVDLGADTIVAWSSIKDGATENAASTTVTITGDSNKTWFVWVEVDISVDPPVARLYGASTIHALTDDEKKRIRQKKIAAITLNEIAGETTTYTIATVKNTTCGNVDISRA